MAVWCLFLRAVNVAGTGLVRMAALRAGLEAAGFTEVQTEGASGNVVARSHAPEAEVVARAEAVALALVGRPTPVIARSPAALAELIARAAAFEAQLQPPQTLAVSLLDGPLDAAGEARLRSADWKGDAVEPAGAELHLRYERGGGRSAITADRLERLAGRRGTARNLSTLRRVLARATG